MSEKIYVVLFFKQVLVLLGALTISFLGLSARAQTQDQVALKNFLDQPRLDLPILLTQTTWADAMEDQYSLFIHTLGAAVAAGKCGTITKCMHNPAANLYAKLDPPGMVFYADCARLAYFLRSYFAYHNGLPFAYVTGVTISQKPYASAADRRDELANARLDDSPYGNRITSRGGFDISPSPQSQLNYQEYLFRMLDEVSTRVLRVGPLTPGFEMSDIYPVPLDHGGIRPGTIVTATGHAMTVWNVNADGSVEIIDGHPGAYIQEHTLNSTKLQRSRPDQGLGFYRFRPLQLVGAQQDFNGSYYGGRVVSETDEQLFAEGKYSLAQWFGPSSNIKPGAPVSPNLWKSAFVDVDFFAYLASRLRANNSRSVADQATADEFQDICKLIKSRQDSVNSTIAAGIPGQPHPSALVADIYGANDADWEEYSTPSSDGRLRDEVKNSVDTAVSQYRLARQSDPHVYFEGSAQDFINTLVNDLHKAARNCNVEYVNSAGQTVALTFNQVLSRLNRLSFDPYMCQEKLWGASGAELGTCRDLDTGNSWYNAEAPIRNTLGKQNQFGVEVVRSTRPITIDMLLNPNLVDQPDSSETNLGTKAVPLMNIESYLRSPAFLQRLTM